jgi:hypothetical protein
VGRVQPSHERAGLDAPAQELRHRGDASGGKLRPGSHERTGAPLRSETTAGERRPYVGRVQFPASASIA